ncbi:MAG: ArnT family glycosyltransferase [Polyangiaceae bacterium]
MTARALRSWILALAACGMVAWVVALVVSRLAPLPGTGFEQRITPGIRCDGEPTTTLVREPFVRHLDDAPPRCVQWSASFVARTKMRLHLETMLVGTASVSIDGHTVLSDEGATEPRAKSGGIDIPSGVHPFVASFRSSGGPAYLRISMDDELDPHDVTVVAPIDDDAFYPTAAAAKTALATPAPERSGWSALLAALALAAAGTLAWLALRLGRGGDLPRADLGIAVALFAAALFVRAHALGVQDICWDEGILSTSEHYVRNVVLGDYFTEAWRHNLEHPPLSKWLLALGDLLGGLEGARLLVGVASSVAVAFLFAFGRVVFGRAVGVVAGGLAVVLPLWVAHGRIAGHESFILFWWGGSMLALACWARSRGDDRAGRGDPVAAFVCVFCATAGVFSRPTGIWIVPVLLGAWVALTRGVPWSVKRLRAFPPAAIAGGLAGLALTIAAWPLLWSSPGANLARMSAHWTRQWGDIEVYMGKLCLPAWHYFLVAFLAETPALLLAAGAAGIALALRPGLGRAWGIVTLLWLVVPFAQSFNTLRIGAGRYVIQAWPALLLFAAIALVALGDFLASLAFDLPKSGRALLRASPAVLAIAYTFVALARVEPYPLDYFDEIVGGPSGEDKPR